MIKTADLIAQARAEARAVAVLESAEAGEQVRARLLTALADRLAEYASVIEYVAEFDAVMVDAGFEKARSDLRESL